MTRALAPATNPTGVTGTAAALYAAGFAIYNWRTGHAPVDWNTIIAVVFAVLNGLWVRGKVTPTADPRDGNGQPLKTANAHTAANFAAAIDQAKRTGRWAEPLPMPPTTSTGLGMPNKTTPSSAAAPADVTLAEPAYPPPPEPPKATP